MDWRLEFEIEFLDLAQFFDLTKKILDLGKGKF